MKLLICIDDTDDFGTPGTGHLAQGIASSLGDMGWEASRITRHQLLVHDDIPYTSHNSSMCFGATVPDDSLSSVIRMAVEYLVENHANGSDPGLAVAVCDSELRIDPLIKYGRSAKERVLRKRDAYDLAEELGVHLSEHGGTGMGVIGALAGIGLRLTGNDGRFKGWLKFKSPSVKVSDLLDHPAIDAVEGMDGTVPSFDHGVRLGRKVKTVWLEHRSVCLVAPNDDGDEPWRTCEKPELKVY